MKQLLTLVLVSTFLVSPSIVHADAVAKVTCMDGTMSKGGKGACSKHGGVNKTAAAETAAPPADAPAPAPTPSKPKATASTSAFSATTKSSGSADAAGATAQCKDGSYSHAKNHSGACSKHGGVANWLDK